jgi:hypothetical protein
MCSLHHVAKQVYVDLHLNIPYTQFTIAPTTEIKQSILMHHQIISIINIFPPLNFPPQRSASSSSHCSQHHCPLRPNLSSLGSRVLFRLPSPPSGIPPVKNEVGKAFGLCGDISVFQSTFAFSSSLVKPASCERKCRRVCARDCAFL